MTTNEIIESIRAFMLAHDLSAFIFPSTDPHSGEYIPAHWMARQWASGFDGSAGTAVVTLDSAALWTDSRYFLQAADQLAGTPYLLMKERIPGTPTIASWLLEVLPPGSCVGMDGWVNMVNDVSQMQQDLQRSGIGLRLDLDPATALWTDRPPIPLAPIRLHPLQYAGETAASKLSRLREKLAEAHADLLVVSQLDEIAWLCNLRGSDVHCNPVFVAYMTVGRESAVLYTDPQKVTPEVAAYLQQEGIALKPYDTVTDDLSQLHECRVMLDPDRTNWMLRGALPDTCTLVAQLSPIAPMKAVKNEVEIAGFRQAMRRDGVAMVRFMRWLKPAVSAGGQTEMSIDRKLTQLRSEQPLYRDISFDTIAGYAEHGAIVHYEATPETDKPLAPRGLLLLDSGAQYDDGTTDITRTIALGPLTDGERRDYTLVLKGHLRLAMAKFPSGSSGTQLDVLARYAMWQEGINYLHGTGHGVGSYLNVHEGPHQIRMNYMPAPILPGMTVTNEPGIYRAGEHGVRIENTMLVQPYRQTDFGDFLELSALTLCPIDLEPVLWDMMLPDEVDYLHRYHQRVCDELCPLLTPDEQEWLKAACAIHVD